MKNFAYYLLLTLVCLLLYLPGIASIPLFDRDEPHFAQATKQMIESGQYGQIYFQDKPRHLKPPGIYWLQAIAVKTLNAPPYTKTWPYRLPSVLGALLAVLGTFAFARRISNPQTALLAALLLASSLLVVVEAHLAVTDAMLLATMTFMQIALGRVYLASRQNQAVHKIWPVCFWLAMTAGILIKGITPLVAGLTILGLGFTQRQWRWLKGLRPLFGLSLLLLLTLCWLIPISLSSGSFFLWDMIHGDILPKLTGGQQSHGMPPGYFTLLLTAIFWPGTWLLLPAAHWAWQQRKQPIVIFLLMWIIPTALFFELIPTKLPEYVMPIFPALAILTALSLTDTGQQQMIHPVWRWLTIIQRILWCLVGLAGAAALIYLGSWGWLSGLLLIALILGVLWTTYQKKTTWAVWIGAIGMIAVFWPLWSILLPQQHSFWISSRLANTIHTTMPDAITSQKPLMVIGYQEPSLVFYLGTDRVVRASMPDALNSIQDQQLLLVNEKQYQQLPHSDWTILTVLSGYQYNGGKSLMLYLLQAKK